MMCMSGDQPTSDAYNRMLTQLPPIAVGHVLQQLRSDGLLSKKRRDVNASTTTNNDTVAMTELSY